MRFSPGMEPMTRADRYPVIDADGFLYSDWAKVKKHATPVDQHLADALRAVRTQGWGTVFKKTRGCKACATDKMCNPATGRCVKKTGKIGLALASAK